MSLLETGPQARQVIDVTTLNLFAKEALAADDRLHNVIVCGEITNYVRNYRSGHCYFTLRDEQSTVKAVLFSRQARLLDFDPEDGMQVLAYGNANIYEQGGAYQLYVDYMRPFGLGAAQKAFDKLKRKLSDEGLFAPEHKKPLPKMPRCIGVVTSKTGAALQDICNVIGRRWPSARLLLAPVSVQGLEAERQIVAGIRALDAHPEVDEILISRGGGSREDLWVFNSERIARAAYACTKPLVSAVGHEIDYTILDYVADLRAPTPSAAAELCVPDGQELAQKIFILKQNIHNNMQHRLILWYNAVESLSAPEQMQRVSASFERKETYLHDCLQQVQASERQRTEQAGARLSAAAALAHSLSPYQVLARGYALVQSEDGRVTAPDKLTCGQTIRVSDSKKTAVCRVEKLEKGGLHIEKAQEL